MKYNHYSTQLLLSISCYHILIGQVGAFLTPIGQTSTSFFSKTTNHRPSLSQNSEDSGSNNVFTSVLQLFQPKKDDNNDKQTKRGIKIAQELLRELVVDDKCYTTVSGAEKFLNCCATDVLYEDTFEPQPIVGKVNVKEHLLKKVAMRKNNENEDFGLRLDQISDGNKACGFAWTYTTPTEEGLRGTTFVELNDQGEICYVREIPEPIYKPGDLTQQLLEAITKGAEPKPPVEYEKRTPNTANEIAQYLYKEVQGSSVDEAMRFFDESILYRDFNYEEILKGKDEVRKFIEDFSFPGITFSMQKIDDGEECTCFTWEVLLEGAEDSIKGISLYRIDPETKLINYVRDVPESAIKPPILGKLARDLRPGLGVFQGVALGSREGGL